SRYFERPIIPPVFASRNGVPHNCNRSARFSASIERSNAAARRMPCAELLVELAVEVVADVFIESERAATTEKSRGKTSSEAVCALVFTSDQLVQPNSRSNRCPNPESTPVRSFSCIAVNTARRPISYALPSSPICDPYPPARAVSPAVFRPTANEPVPANSTIAGPSPVAANARSRSVQIRTDVLGNSAAKSARIFSADSGGPAPARPAQSAAAVDSAGSLAWLIASLVASRIEPIAAPNPTRSGFEGPDCERVRIAPVPSINTQSVFVPPPSNPKTKLMQKA